ncbi:hypothetical protein BSBH6_02334 [Bacillus subtilis]|nr:hypothetical protein BSBH6_02334 [Bacillus subtilis]RPK24944.1 hypothetical protein BH5_01775 [Bacillus subtilis]
MENFIKATYPHLRFSYSVFRNSFSAVQEYFLFEFFKDRIAIIVFVKLAFIFC